MKKLFTVLMLLLAGVVTVSAGNLFPDPGIRQKRKWSLPEGFRITADASRPGDNMMMAERSDSAKYTVARYYLKLKPGAYKLTLEARSENLKGSMAACAEFHSRDGKYLDGGIYPGKGHSPKWTEISGEFQVPENAASVTVGLYLWRASTGRAWFRNIRIEPITRTSVYLLVPAQPNIIREGGNELIFGAFHSTPGLKLNSVVEFFADGKKAAEFTAPVKEERISGVMNLPATKQGMFKVTMRDADGKTVDVTKIPAQVLPASFKAPANASVLDRRGRLRVNGRKFFPLGLFMNHYDARFLKNDHNLLPKDLEIIGKSPFNCIMPYDALRWKEGEIVGRTTTREQIRGIMDLCSKNGIKVIFSVMDVVQKKPWWTNYGGAGGEKEALEKIIGDFKDHPALLAWYTFDEAPLSQRDYQRGRCRLINRLDPWHPTWMVHCNPARNSAMLGGVANVYGTDPYPINRGSADTNHQNALIAWTELTMNICRVPRGGALWNCPQIYNDGHYKAAGDKVKDHHLYQYPTEQEMRSMVLMQLIMGVKGMIMYSYFDLFSGPEGRKEFDRRWPEVCRVAKLVSELGDYVLGDEDGCRFTWKQTAGTVKAASFKADDGREAVLISASGPGTSGAELELPGRWASRYGRTVRNARGVWVFHGKNMDGDVLFRVR